MKAIKDPKIKQIINENKDFEMKLTSNDVLNVFKGQKIQEHVVEEKIKKPKLSFLKPLIFSMPLIAATCLAIIIPLSLQNKSKPQYVNQSSNLDFLSVETNRKIIGKELYLFGLNNVLPNDEETQPSLKFKSANALNYKEIIIDGFKNMIPLFLNELVDFNDIETSIHDAIIPVEVDGIKYDKVLISNYLIVPFCYYFSSNENVENGYLKIFTSTYEVKINEVIEKNNQRINLNITNDDSNTYFKIINNGNDNFTFLDYLDKTSYINDKYNFKNYMNLNIEDPSYELEKNENYYINYKNISLIDIILNFDVVLKDYINHKILDFDCSFNKNDNEIIIK